MNNFKIVLNWQINQAKNQNSSVCFKFRKLSRVFFSVIYPFVTLSHTDTEIEYCLFFTDGYITKILFLNVLLIYF